MAKTLKVAVVGSGPSGLMAAHTLATQEHSVTVFERRPGLGRKLLIAGASGLNISHDASIEEFLQFYRDRDPGCDPRLLEAVRGYPPPMWLQFVKDLGHEVFVGSSRRWFVREMKASGLLASWSSKLKGLGVTFTLKNELRTPEDLEALRSQFDHVVLALGGGSWEEDPPLWPGLLRHYGVSVRDFLPSNVGYEVDFPKALLDEAEGKPVKHCLLTTSLGSKQGELVITRYGLEGTPMYFMGTPGVAHLDLKPDLSFDEWLRLLSRPLRENLSPLRRIKKLGGLSEGALALLFHLTPVSLKRDLTLLAKRAKHLPIELRSPRPLAEAISSQGGVAWSELTPELMLKKIPGVFCAGEMIDWDAPTGGFLIQASVALGRLAGLQAGAKVSRLKN